MVIDKGKYNVYKGDCLEVMNGLIALGVKFDAIITDPPYGITACKWDSVIPFDEMWKRLNKLIKPNGAIVLFASEPFSSSLRMSNIKDYKYDWYWNKCNSGNILSANYMPLKVIENICIFSKNKSIYNPQKIKRTDDEIKEFVSKRGKNHVIKKSDMFNSIKRGAFIYSGDVEYKNPVNLLEFNARKNECNNRVRIHPTQKPVLLLEYLIKTYTNEGGLILDFAMGSGSTGVACLKTNRRFVGIELDEKYFNISCERLEELS
ncbi:site-specific DNA-methyltransferase [Clostridioides sp. ES-S-0049-03]|uniref:DNA-methyltransferase n=1 Tax=Clostridioides sp. ES-S-0049-03 TaxID=2770779 RepID=UPI001D1047F3|nr:site-specific DNA-methyltransferase [Clostridioides sp. ES-S-0049-03]